MTTYTTDDEVCFAIEVRVPLAFAAAFARAMTGNDDDIILAAEHLFRARIDGAAGADESIELITDGTAARAALRDVGDAVTCGCGAVTTTQCGAARERYFSSLQQRSIDELRVLHEGDDSAAAGLLLKQRLAQRSP